MKEIETIALIGLGAIGSYLATHLQIVLGDNLRIIAGGERGKRLRENGIVVNGKPYSFHIVDPKEETGYVDLAIFITKFTGLREAMIDMKNQVGPDTLLMAPLNGVEAEDVLADTYGYDNIIYSLARVAVTMVGNRVTYKENGVAHFEYGEKTNETISERVQRIRALFDESGLTSVIQKDMIHAIWHKYMCNVSENQSAAVLGIPFGAWSVSEHANAIRESLMREVVAVAAKKGIILTEEDIAEQGRRLTKIAYNAKPSTLQDIQAGKKTEVDMFSGTMIRMGKELGVPTPVNEIFYHAIRVLEEKNEGLI